jgi:hypothetical protein
MGYQQDTVAGFDISFEGEDTGSYLQSCKLRLKKGDSSHLIEGASIPGQDLSTKAFHITEDGDNVTHLFTCQSGVVNGDVVTKPTEVFENPFLSEKDLVESDNSLFGGLHDDMPGEADVEAVSEDADGIFVFIRCTNADEGTSEYDLQHFEAKIYADGQSLREFEMGRPL